MNADLAARGEVCTITILVPEEKVCIPCLRWVLILWEAFHGSCGMAVSDGIHYTSK